MSDALGPLLHGAFTLWGTQVSWIELAAFVLSIWMVVCNMRVDPLAWPLAIVASLLYGVLFAHSRLYGEAGLQGVFIAVALWGWWQWTRGHQADGSALAVRWLAGRARAALLLAALAVWPLLALLLDHATDSDVPWFDALPTTFSLLGQWLLGRQYVENWPVWLGVNLVSVALFVHKGLWLTALLYALFALLSLAGWRSWSRRARRAPAALAAGRP